MCPSIRVVSNKPDFKRNRREKFVEHWKGERLYRIQQKNSYGAWADISELLDRDGITGILKARGLDIESVFGGGRQISIPFPYVERQFDQTGYFDRIRLFI